VTDGDRGTAVPAAAILFDNDGVLSDSLETVDACWRRWALSHGLDADEVIAHIHGRPARESIALLAPHLDLEASFTELEDLEVAASDATRPMPGAVALTLALPRDRWIVVTSGTRRLAEARFAATTIDPPAIITADDVELGKPHPAPYLAAAARLGVDPRDCIVFEDTAPGVAAGRAAGATVIGVVGGGGESNGAHYHVPDLTHIEVEVAASGLEITIV